MSTFINLVRHPVTPVWLLLVCATALSWWMGNDSAALGIELRYVSTALLVVAFIKVRFVIRFFMEVRHAPLALRLLADAWVFGVCAVLVALYWNGLA